MTRKKSWQSARNMRVNTRTTNTGNYFRRHLKLEFIIRLKSETLTLRSNASTPLSREALRIASARPEIIAFTKCVLAKALNDNGQTEEALKQTKEAYALAQGTKMPPAAAADVLFQISNYASQLGVEQDVTDVIAALKELPESADDVKQIKERALARTEANGRLRRRLLEVLHEGDPANAAGTASCTTLWEANAAVVRPLLHWWDDLRDIDPTYIAGAYDFWGRGNLQRMLFNARRFSDCFNVTLEVRSLDDVKRSLRIWGLYADFLVLLWKGPTENGFGRILFPDDYEEPGGWGYVVFAGTDVIKEGSTRRFCLGMGNMSALPNDVAVFLSTEAKSFLQSGRLIVVPAVGAGCINPGHGPFEQLLAESANAIPSVRARGIHGTPIGYMPYSSDAPFELIAELAESESDRLRKLRLLLLRRSAQVGPGTQLTVDSKILSLEINDALRDFEDRTKEFIRKKGLTRATEPLVGATTRFRLNGEKLAGDKEESPFAPLFILQSLGYGWRVDSSQVPRFPERFEPQKGDMIGAWLAPPSAGWSIPTFQIPSSD
jgi:hypothetical protein